MTHAVAFDAQFESVVHTFSGVVTMDQILAATAKGAELGFEHARHRYLVDLRKAELQTTAVELIELPERSYPGLDLPRQARIAVLTSERNHEHPLVRFYETSCTNRGWLVRTFPSRTEAVEWLQREDAE